MSIIILPSQLKKQVNEIKKNYFIPSIKKMNGNILEIGFGNGEYFEIYNNNSKVYAIEINDKLLKKNNKRNIKLIKGTAENIPFDNNFFDTIVVSFVLCSVSSVNNSLNEIHRVLKKGGTFILLEHIKSNNIVTIAVQKLITKIQSIFISCRMDRDPRLYINKDKFEILIEKEFKNDLEPYLFMKLRKK